MTPNEYTHKHTNRNTHLLSNEAGLVFISKAQNDAYCFGGDKIESSQIGHLHAWNLVCQDTHHKLFVDDGHFTVHG